MTQCFQSTYSGNQYKKCNLPLEKCNQATTQCEPVKQELGFPGERCEDICVGICQNGVCQGKEEGEYCYNTIQCNPGLMCLNTKCEKLLTSFSSGCTQDYDCTNNNACVSNQCIPYHSLKTGEYTPICNQKLSHLCQTGLCYQDICIEKPKTKPFAGTECKNGDNCTIEIDGMLFIGQCNCEYSANPKQICSYTVVDELYQEFLEMEKEWRTGEEINFCNSYRRLELGCKKSWASEEFFKRYWTLQGIINCGLYVKNTDDCVISGVCPEYYEVLTERVSYE